ncbi:MAG: chemotaxis protein CheA [Boseongicola sp.]|nr:chemotaxis protein CheA [Boseongicola sp.]NNJ66875.1 chemotaxis protein CheA [Boseongicola sp.]
MSDPMQEIRASFFVECEELLENLFDAIQEMTEDPANKDTINIAFRAVHSIKGGAGAFQLDDLVAFAHQFETAMDMVRSDALEAGDTLVALFFRCGDMLSDLVRMSREGEDIDPDLYAPLIAELAECAGISLEEEEAEVDPADFQPMTLDLDLGADVDADFSFEDADFDAELAAILNDPPAAEIASDAPSGGGLSVHFAPKQSIFENGNEPLFLLRNLSDLSLCDIQLSFTPSQSFEQALDAPGLAWTLQLLDGDDEIAAREVFEFVDGLCELTIERTSPQTAPEPMASEADTQLIEVEAPKSSTPKPTSLPDPAPEDVPTAEVEPPSKPEPPAKEPKPASAKQSAPSATVRVDLDRIDRLVNLVGELVINQAMLSQSVLQAGLPKNTNISTGLDEFMQLTRDIQESVMMIRAQPVKSLFQRMSRIVREASAAVDKKVRLVTDGENTEIDKTVIERLADPLTHMIRNAVDHGLETSDQRLASGKSAEGVVRLTAAHRSGRVIIEISDDGSGINRPKVREIAVSKGLIHKDSKLTDSEIENLLFMPGFSTATEISNLSGRGVGMDVVKSAITALGGRISISSTDGKGTVFSISLPLTLAVLDGMVISVAGETLVVPLNAIAETLTLQPEIIERLGPETTVISVRDEFVPLFDLGVELGYRKPKPSYEGAIALLVVQEDGARSALVVDDIEDQRQVVIKGLQDSYGSVPGVAAATILGDGQIALILDAADLLGQATGRSRDLSTLEKAG